MLRIRVLCKILMAPLRLQASRITIVVIVNSDSIWTLGSLALAKGRTVTSKYLYPF